MPTGVRYRFLRFATWGERVFPDVPAALDRACRDLSSEDAAPLEIVVGDEVVLTATDIFEHCAATGPCG